MKKGEQITEITIDLMEYEQYKVINMVPVWNVKEINLLDKSFSIVSQDRIHHEHLVDISETGEENGYMLTLIEDNIRVDNDKKVLILKFKAINKEDYLIYDKMSFLMSDIQLLFPEYMCIGEFV